MKLKPKSINFHLLLFFAALVSLFPAPVRAICPVCTVAVGAGLGLSRWLGIDDTISGLWMGGFLLSFSLWLVEWLKRKKPKWAVSAFRLPVIISSYLLALLPLTATGVINHPLNTIFGIDKLILGIILGSIVFYLSILIDNKVRKVFKKQLFPYQKVVFPVFGLIVISLIMFYILSL